MSEILQRNRKRLLEEYTSLTGKDPDSNCEFMVMGIPEEVITMYEWQLTGIREFPCKLVDSDQELDDDPFAIPEPSTNFGVEAEPNHAEYTDDPFESALARETLKSSAPTQSSARDIMMVILPAKERDKLLVNHNQNSGASAQQILEGFGMESLIDAYAEGLTNEDVCRYLKITPGQIKSWLAKSTQRMALVAQLKDIMRASKVDKTLDDAMDYQVGQVHDKHDAALEALKINAMKMKTGVALNLDQRSRGQENGDGTTLPVINLGLSVNVNQQSTSEALDHATPIIPGVVVKRD